MGLESPRLGQAIRSGRLPAPVGLLKDAADAIKTTVCAGHTAFHDITADFAVAA